MTSDYMRKKKNTTTCCWQKYEQTKSTDGLDHVICITFCKQLTWSGRQKSVTWQTK